MKDILEFQGSFRWLSNFWPAAVELDGVTFPSVEHAYQAAKFRESGPTRVVIKDLTAGEAKRLGRTATLPHNWEKDKLWVMDKLLRQKFAAGSELAHKLVDTGNAKIEEGNRWGDTFWGVDLKTGQGQNMLGKMIMQIRSDLRKDHP